MRAPISGANRAPSRVVYLRQYRASIAPAVSARLCVDVYRNEKVPVGRSVGCLIARPIEFAVVRSRPITKRSRQIVGMSVE